MDIPHPEAQVPGTGRETHPHLAFPECALAQAQLPLGLRGAQDVLAKFKAHRQNHAEEGEADQVGKLKHPGMDERGYSRCQEDEESDTSAHDDCAPSKLCAASLPQSERGIDHEKEDEKRTQFPQACP